MVEAVTARRRCTNEKQKIAAGVEDETFLLEQTCRLGDERFVVPKNELELEKANCYKLSEHAYLVFCWKLHKLIGRTQDSGY